jgi:hypothetical protein
LEQLLVVDSSDQRKQVCGALLLPRVRMGVPIRGFWVRAVLCWQSVAVLQPYSANSRCALPHIMCGCLLLPAASSCSACCAGRAWRQPCPRILNSSTCALPHIAVCCCLSLQCVLCWQSAAVCSPSTADAPCLTLLLVAACCLLLQCVLCWQSVAVLRPLPRQNRHLSATQAT